MNCFQNSYSQILRKLLILIFLFKYVCLYTNESNLIQVSRSGSSIIELSMEKSRYESLEDLDDEGRRVQLLKMNEHRLKCELNKSNDLNNLSEKSEPKKCPMSFDQILCWDEAPANTWSYLDCPTWFIGFKKAKGSRAKRFCNANGNWAILKETNMSYTDYVECIPRDWKIYNDHIPKVRLIAKIGSSISLVSLIIAIILLGGLKRLHCARNILHINLFGSFLLFSLLQLIKESTWVNSIGFPKDVVVGLGGVEMNLNVSHWECQFFMSLYRYAESSNHVMVFCEALYLNTLISVSTFSESNHFKFYVVAGWAGPLIWIIPFITVMAIFFDHSCWTGESKFSYLYVGPQILLIILNFVLFMNIVRILGKKLKNSQLTDSKNYRYKKLAKSTLILLPLFSIYYIAFSVWQPFVQNKLPPEMDVIRLYFEIICSSFQGLLISSIYCFFNSEVRQEIIKVLERRLLQRNPNMRRFSSLHNGYKDRVNSVVSVGNDRLSRSSRIDNRLKRNSSSTPNRDPFKGKNSGKSSYLDEEIHFDSKYLNQILERNNLLRSSINKKRNETNRFYFFKFFRRQKKQSEDKSLNSQSKKSSHFESSRNSQITIDPSELNLRRKNCNSSGNELTKQRVSFNDYQENNEKEPSTAAAADELSGNGARDESVVEVAYQPRQHNFDIANQDEIVYLTNFEKIMPYSDVNNNSIAKEIK